MHRILFALFVSMAWSALGVPPNETYSETRQGPLGEDITVSYFPSCDSETNPNTDCAPPEIGKFESREVSVKYQEEVDPEHGCNAQEKWGVRVRMRARLTAMDASGVKAVGFYVKQRVEQMEYVTEFWSNVEKASFAPSMEVNFQSPEIEGGDNPPQPRPERDGDARPRTFEMSKILFACVPKGRRLEFWVSDLCAMDLKDNWRCVPYAPKQNQKPGNATKPTRSNTDK